MSNRTLVSFGSLLLLLCCLLSPSLSLPVSASTNAKWLFVTHEDCDIQAFRTGFAAWNDEDTYDTNYLGSKDWVLSGEVNKKYYVRGTAWGCFDGNTIDTDLQLPLGDCVSAADGFQPPLDLYQCYPFPSQQYSAYYVAVGIPLLYFFLRWVQRYHRELIGWTPKRRRCCGGRAPLFHQAYGMWPLLFGDIEKDVESQYWSDKRMPLYVRYVELEHSFFCFFFISPGDRFGWKSRFVVLIFEQAINLVTQCLITFIFHTNGQGTENPAFNNAFVGSLLTVVLSVIMGGVISVIFPIRRLWGWFMRRPRASCGRVIAGFWLFISLLVVIIGTILMFVRMNTVGKDTWSRAPSPGWDLIQHTLVAYCAALPYHLLVEIPTVLALQVVCIRALFIDKCDEYTRAYCVDPVTGYPADRTKEQCRAKVYLAAAAAKAHGGNNKPAGGVVGVQMAKLPPFNGPTNQVHPAQVIIHPNPAGGGEEEEDESSSSSSSCTPEPPSTTEHAPYSHAQPPSHPRPPPFAPTAHAHARPHVYPVDQRAFHHASQPSTSDASLVSGSGTGSGSGSNQVVFHVHRPSNSLPQPAPVAYQQYGRHSPRTPIPIPVVAPNPPRGHSPHPSMQFQQQQPQQQQHHSPPSDPPPPYSN